MLQVANKQFALFPVVFRQTVQEQNSHRIGVVGVLEDNEVADAVVHFVRARSQNILFDAIALKRYLFQIA